MFLHATSVSVLGHGVLILGSSGAGKSSLALQLMAYGAVLISDDQTRIELKDAQLVASAPQSIVGRIEARGVGILNAGHNGPTPLALVVDLEKTEHARLPEAHFHTILGVSLPCLWRAASPHFAPAILQYVSGHLCHGS